MRVVCAVVTVFVILAGSSVAQAKAPSNEPSASLAQLMRAIFFPNSDIIFDVQARDPDAPPEAANDGSVSSTFASIYTGWPVVENAALALAEASNLIMLTDRMCENGRPVPLANDDFVQYAQEMEAAGRAAAAVARTEDRDAMIEATNEIAGACENCHDVYRRYPEENRCQRP